MHICTQNGSIQLLDSLYDTSYSWHKIIPVQSYSCFFNFHEFKSDDSFLRGKFYTSKLVSQYIKYCVSIGNWNLIMSYICCRSSAVLMQTLLPNSPLQELLASLHTRWIFSIDVLLFLLRCHMVCSICWFSPICPPTKSKVWLRCGRHSQRTSFT